MKMENTSEEDEYGANPWHNFEKVWFFSNFRELNQEKFKSFAPHVDVEAMTSKIERLRHGGRVSVALLHH